MLNYIKLATNKETTFDGFNLPVGSIYGRRKSERFVCTNYSGISKEKMKIFPNKAKEIAEDKDSFINALFGFYVCLTTDLSWLNI